MNEFETLRHILQSYCSENPVIIEAGCYDGKETQRLYSYCLAEPHKYFAFECDPRNIEKIVANPNFPKSAMLIQKAIGNIDGEVLLYLSIGESEIGFKYDCASSIRKPKDVSKDFPLVKFEADPIAVQCVKLDTFCAKNTIEIIDLIFADIQGAEKDLILGGQKMLKKTKFLYLEKSNDSEWYAGQWLVRDLIKHLSELGFEVYRDFTCDILFRNSELPIC